MTYHHLVFTLPSELNQWVERHPSVVYHLLFQCAWKTLKDFGADPRRLNGQMGMTAVLHTWGENLSRHVHLHCLVPGGALSATDQWHAAKSDYLFPVRALSRGFRGRMVSALRQAERSGQLPYINAEHDVDKVLDALMGMQWVVYSKPCPSKTKTVIDYLGRYSHRIAISDQRIVAMDEHSVQFSYKYYRENAARKQLTLNADEFIRRYLLHVLPKGLMRIRHYSFLGNRCRRKNLMTLTAAIMQSDELLKKPKSQSTERKPEMPHNCPKCLVGKLVQGRPERDLPTWRVILCGNNWVAQSESPMSGGMKKQPEYKCGFKKR